MKVITVFGSSKAQEGTAAYNQAVELGCLLAKQQYIVCNGGYKGIMSASARGAKEAGGRTMGITTKQFPGTVNPWIDEEKSFENWQDRLFGLIETGDAFVLCDGGTGTLTELFVTWEMIRQNMVQKPLIILGPFSRWMVDALQNPPLPGISAEIEMVDPVRIAKTPAEVLEHLAHFKAKVGVK